jgi:hypothetical protein
MKANENVINNRLMASAAKIEEWRKYQRRIENSGGEKGNKRRSQHLGGARVAWRRGCGALARTHRGGAKAK